MRKYDLRVEAEVVDHYLKNLYYEARQRLLKEMYSLGCGCRNCKRKACNELTQIELYILHKPQGSQFWFVDLNGDIQFYQQPNRVLQPEEFEGPEDEQPYDSDLDNNLDANEDW